LNYYLDALLDPRDGKQEGGLRASPCPAGGRDRR